MPAAEGHDQRRVDDGRRSLARRASSRIQNARTAEHRPRCSDGNDPPAAAASPLSARLRSSSISSRTSLGCEPETLGRQAQPATTQRQDRAPSRRSRHLLRHRAPRGLNSRKPCWTMINGDDPDERPARAAARFPPRRLVECWHADDISMLALPKSCVTYRLHVTFALHTSQAGFTARSLAAR